MKPIRPDPWYPWRPERENVAFRVQKASVSVSGTTEPEKLALTLRRELCKPYDKLGRRGALDGRDGLEEIGSGNCYPHIPGIRTCLVPLA